MLGESGEASLEGVLERIVYASEENAWSVVRLTVPGQGPGEVTAVGNLLGVQPGESLRLFGRWVEDRKYGRQFKTTSYVTIEPSTLVGIEKYLGSGLVEGIGKVMAARLVARFGLDTLEVIEHHAERLTEVEGIGRVRSQRIRAAWAEQRAIKDVMVFLQAHGVSTSFAVKIFKRYGPRAIAMVRENPYRLASDVHGIGFKSADLIASRLGIVPDSPFRAAAGLLHVLQEASEEGHVFVPRSVLLERTAALLGVELLLLEAALAELAGRGEVVVEPRGDDAAVYLRPLHAAETGAARLLHGLLQAPAAPLVIDTERALAWFEAQQGVTLAPRQRAAVCAAIEAKVLVITGGPGTGKTTIVNAIIRILARKGRRILLAAPTGRAARRLGETTGHPARTIHRLLEFSPKQMAFARNAERPLEADLLVVDEASMVDTVLFRQLLEAVPPPCQLVLVGDVDQLPSVGPGTVLGDVIRSAAVEVVTLDEIFRQAGASRIVVNAHRINRGEMPLLAEEGAGERAGETRQRGAPHLREGLADDFFFVERDEPEDVLTVVKELVAHRIPRRFGLDPVGDVQVLTPMHRGTLGAANLNAELQALLNPHGRELARGSRLFRTGDKVIQQRNDYDLEVFNGDIGRVVGIDEDARKVQVRFEERTVGYDAADLDALSLAYACSVHKSQGSEYPAVVLPLHGQHYVMLQRNLLYTAITRARRLVVLVGSRKALAQCVRNRRVEERYTRLAERLRDRV